MQHFQYSVVLYIELEKMIKMKIKNILIIGMISLVTIWSTSCKKITGIGGNNIVESETRSLVSFDKVENDGTFSVFIRQDSVFTATVEAESNLIPYVRTRVNGNTLIIDTRENLKNNVPINVYVTTPIIHSATLSGSGFVTLDSLDTDNLEVVLSGSGKISGYAKTDFAVTRISGSGNITLESYTESMDARISGSGDLDLTGETSSGTFTISGSGAIHSYNYFQKNCIAKISGSGDMQLNVSELLDVNISGSGSVYYIGSPGLNVKITGSGQVIKQ